MSPLGPESSGDNLVFTDIEKTNQVLYLTVAHPSNYVNQVHLLAGSDLVAQDWAFAGFLDADPTNYVVLFTLDQSGAGPYPNRFAAGFDNDDDGMADWWEVEFLGSLDPTGAQDDDEDKLQNLFEYYAGTDPLEGFTDSDGDGMSDDWESYYELDRNDPSDADEDPDEDGFTNLEEFLNNGEGLGTDPREETSHPAGAVYVDEVNGSDGDGNGAITNAYATISKGVAQADPGDHVVILPGTYSGTSNCNVEVTKKLIITGILDQTVIDGENENCAFWISGSAASDTVLRNLAILNGYRYTPPGQEFGGGGVVCTDTHGFTINSCVFSNCHTTGELGESYPEGGGLAFFQGSDLVLQDCLFNSCSAADAGGGVSVKYSEAIVLDGCTISSNVAAQFFGGGLYTLYATNVLVRNCVVHDNHAGTDGGGLDFEWSMGVVVENSVLFGNSTATLDGGGIFLHVVNSDSLIRNCLLFDNSAYGKGGGVGARLATHGTYHVILESSTVTTNSAGDSGGGVRTDAALSLTNSIVYFNPSDDEKDLTADSVEMAYCCVPSNVVISSTHSITNDPEFVDLDNDDYRLQTNSLCVNSGTNLTWMTNAFDLDGNPRIADGTVDMGAYERQ